MNISIFRRSFLQLGGLLFYSSPTSRNIVCKCKNSRHLTTSTYNCFYKESPRNITIRKSSTSSSSSSSVVQCEDDEFSGNLGADLVEICGVPSDTAVRQKVLLVHLEDTNVRRSKLASGGLELHERQEQYRVDEAKALVQSVISWKVVADISYTVDLNHLNKDHVLHKRNLADLNLFLSRRKDISVVFINIPQMSSVQFANLLKLWSRYIVDRYMMVLTIFRLQASSKEAKLQVARLMISLIKHRMEQNNILPKFLGRGLGNSKSWGRGKTAKGAVTAKEHRKLHIQAIDSKVKEELASLKRERQKNRTRKQLSNMPIISVVGYTNCGKTTLVKSLTRSDKLKPLDKLFATTEVSTHHGELNHGWTCMYNDTVGLISEMPHELVEAFVASFEDILRGHLIVNVTDISHPDWTNQLRVVHETIQSAMSREEANQIEANDSNGCTNQRLIQVFNKCDKLGDNDKDHILDSYGKIVADFDIARSEPPIFTVATQGAGNAELLERIYEELLLTGHYSEQTFYLNSYDSQYEFLQKFACTLSEDFITECSHSAQNDSKDGPPGCIVIKVVIHDVAMRQFSAYFPANETAEKYRQAHMVRDDWN